MTEKLKDCHAFYMCRHVLRHNNKAVNTQQNPCKDFISDEDYQKKVRIYKILFEKFTKFRDEPNKKQRIKIDNISDKLKPFFGEEDSEKDKTDKKKWIISFKNIINIFPNVKEINLLNQYKLNEGKVFNNLIGAIENKENKLNKISFLYYDYSGTFFQNSEELKKYKKKLNKSNIEMKYGRNGKVGYTIRIYKM